MALPDELCEADGRYHAVLAAIRFSRHLNPWNVQEARMAFDRGGEAPPFAYHPATWAEDVLATLDGLRIPREHPLGIELAAAVAETRDYVCALRDRDAASFDDLNTRCGWYGDGDEDRVPDVLPAVADASVPAEEMFEILANALALRGYLGWTVSWDTVMASRVLVDASKRELRINPAARFREGDRAGLVAHEIDVHVARGAAGEAQPLKLFSTGLARAAVAEEGLAIAAEERVGTLSPAFEARGRVVAEAIRRGRECGFRELHEWLRTQCGPAMAWGVALRVKRGLARPDLPGVYAKDAVYLRGWRAVKAWRGDLRHLYVGKVGLHHPVGEWIAEGWVAPGDVPALWATRSPG